MGSPTSRMSITIQPASRSWGNTLAANSDDLPTPEGPENWLF
jgi:hypothetical protein